MYHRLFGKFSKCQRQHAETDPSECTVEQILDVPVPEMVKQLVEEPKTIPQDRIHRRTVEHIADDTPIPQDVEEPAEFFKAFSQDRVQLRVRGQIIENPAIPLAEKIVELPVIQTEEKRRDRA